MGLGGGGDARLGLKQEGELAAIRLVRAALDRGINFIDTAESYGTEAVIGAALKGVARDSVILSTKKTAFDDNRFAAEDLVHSLEASLERLGTDYIDIYHLHGVRHEDYADLYERIVPALQRLREQGKIRFLGITEPFAHDPSHQMLQRALRDDVWDVVMVGFNMLNQSARRTIFPVTLAKNVGTLIMFAVRRALSRPDRLRELLREITEKHHPTQSLMEIDLESLVREGGATSMTDAAYRFCRYEPGAHVILSGTGNLEHVADNAQSLNKCDLSADVRGTLSRLFDGIDDVSGH